MEEGVPRKQLCLLVTYCVSGIVPGLMYHLTSRQLEDQVPSILVTVFQMMGWEVKEMEQLAQDLMPVSSELTWTRGHLTAVAPSVPT